MQKVVTDIVEILIENLAYLQELDEKQKKLENELIQALKDLGFDYFIATKRPGYRHEYRILDNECYEITSYDENRWIIVNIVQKDISTYIKDIIDALEFQIEMHEYCELQHKLECILQDYK